MTLALPALVLAAPPTTAAQSSCRAPDARSVMPDGPVKLIIRNAAGVGKQIYTRSRALLIGESAYQFGDAGLDPLAAVPHELENLKAALESQGFDVSLYLNLDSSELQSVIECNLEHELPSDPQMRFLFWFAGHATTLHDGLVPEGDGFMLPVDVRREPGKRVSDAEAKRKGLRYSAFIHWARDVINVKHALFVFDSCFSGTLLDNPTRSDYIPPRPEKPSPPVYALSDEVQKPSREFLTSGTAEQKVPAAGLFADYFTKALLGERREADGNHDNVLIGDELVLFMKQYVSQDSRTQTPTYGRLTDKRYKGEILFTLPPAPAGATLAATLASPPAGPSGTMKPVFIGTSGGRGGATRSDAAASADPTLVQFFITDRILTTERTACDSNCDTLGSSKQYRLELTLPTEAPPGALLDVPELQCIAGPCAAGGKIVDAPSLSADKLSASVSLLAWGEPSTWRLASRLVIPSASVAVSGPTGAGSATGTASGSGTGRAPGVTGSAAVVADTQVVVDSRTGKVNQIKTNHITIVSNKSAPNIAEDAELQSLLTAIESDDTKVRRSARAQLADVIARTHPDTITQLIRRMPGASYRYQIGVAQALGAVPGGWLSGDAGSRTVLLGLRMTRARHAKVDPTLRELVSGAVLNQRVFAYYEISKHWLTHEGRLKPKSKPNYPLPEFATLQTGDILLAEDGVWLRGGSGAAFSSVSLLKRGQCVRVVQRDQAYQSAEASGGWLQVLVRRRCTPDA
jgi:hypothetical protein